MANLNTKRKRRRLAEEFRKQHIAGWKITPPQRKRHSPWRGEKGWRPVYAAQSRTVRG